MATTFSQAERPLQVTTPLGKDAVLLVGLTGQEALSRLFSFQLDLLAPLDKNVAFDQLLGQPISVELTLLGGKKRHFHGICCRISQGDRDEDFITYRAEIVPQFWLLTRRVRSRIFQHQSVPDILKKVLTGLDVTFELQGTFQPRNYCVQYRESDFQFASRIMEEEGMYYYFKHTAGGHKMLVANALSSHAEIPGGGTLLYEPLHGGNRGEDRITEWTRLQELRSGKVTLWDHCFELPHKHLEAESPIQATAQAGKNGHKLKVAGNDQLEVYDWPGVYANRFDGIDRGGGERPADLQKIFEDNRRTTSIRMQEEAAHSLIIEGGSSCGQITAGHKFTLKQHFNADDNYVFTAVNHSARLAGNYRGDGSGEFAYHNRFTCIPLAIPFRPSRTTPKPVVGGSQTAVVVGPAGEEIFTDKYSRVKVQFHWDREGKNDADSSCWVRVGSMWAGKQWGMIHIPRVGQEVIVDFLEGDPDKPIVVGSVYNAEMMPPYGLPDNRTQSGIKSRSSPGGGTDNFNEIRLEDKKGSEQVYIHAEKNQDIEVENDETHWVGHDRKKTIDNDETTHVKHDRTETVDNNETITVHGARTETVDKNETISIHASRTESVDMNETITVMLMRTRLVGINESVTVGAAQEVTVGGMRAVTVGATQAVTVGSSQTITVGGNETETYGRNHTQSAGGSQSITVGGDRSVDVAKNNALSAGQDGSINIGKVLAITAGDAIKLTTGDASIIMKKNGEITISGKDVIVKATGKINAAADGAMTLKGSKINEN